MDNTDIDDDIKYILANLLRLDALLRREVLSLKARSARADDPYRGLYLSEEDVQLVLESHRFWGLLGTHLPPDGTALQDLEAAVAGWDDTLSRMRAERAEAGGSLRLDRFAGRFGLSAGELQVVLVCLAAEVDVRYEQVFAYLQDDVTKKRPTVQLTLLITCHTLVELLTARRWFEPGAPLVRWQVVTLHEDPNTRRSALPSRYLALDDRVAGHLLGSPGPDPRLTPLVRCSPDGVPPAADVAERVHAAVREWAARTGPAEPVLVLRGNAGTGRHAAAGLWAKGLGRRILYLEMDRLHEFEGGVEAGVRLAEREALLEDLVVCWCDADRGEGDPAWVEAARRFHRAVAVGRRSAVMTVGPEWRWPAGWGSRPVVVCDLPDPTHDERTRLWAAALAHNGGFDANILDSLAARFRLTGGQIRTAATEAAAVARTQGRAEVTAADVDAACRAQTRGGMSLLAKPVRVRHTLDDVVLPPLQRAELRLLCARVRERSRVYGEWGFGQVMAYGKGVLALFAGPPGTGKTMAAQAVAHDLGLDLYRIDLSAVVNKYIGETEKNLERVFAQAQRSDAVLFFDEADALFGKRSEVKDAHDRYANIETAFLLQRTEDYDGLVVLASNLKGNMDEAFLRRLHFAIDFPLPEEAERLEIWKRTLPPEAPTGSDLDLPFLARKFKVTGGNIRNMVLGAAFLAADSGGRIGMRELMQAAVHELRKIGRLVVSSDLLPYISLIEDGPPSPP
jgi:ATP-dependent 26S proteasome regulatory subunit